MAEIHDTSKARQIRTLLSVLGAGIIAALVLAGGMLYRYNPEGTYLAKNALLSPENIEKIDFQNSNSKDKQRLVFSNIEFSYFDKESKKWKRMPISLDKYTKFYALIKDSNSLPSVPPDIIAFFSTPLVANLKINANREKISYAPPESVLQVDFIPNHFRIQIRSQQNSEEWAYYHAPNIEEQILNIFLSQ